MRCDDILDILYRAMNAEPGEQHVLDNLTVKKQDIYKYISYTWFHYKYIYIYKYKYTMRVSLGRQSSMPKAEQKYN